MQHRTIFAVGKGHVSEGDGAGSVRERPGIRPLYDIRCLVKQREGPLGAGEMQLEAGGLPADGPQRLIQLGQVAHHHEQLTQREHAGPHMLDADEEHRRHSARRGQADEKIEGAFQAGQTHPGPHAFPGAAGEALLFPQLLTERLDDTQGGQDLLHDREGGALELLHLP